jgi:protoporphyrinogen oxidase
MANIPIAVLGTGMAGFGAGRLLRSEGVPFVCYDKNPYCGGHARSVRYGNGFIFDEGIHISFTSSPRIQEIFTTNVDGRQIERKLTVDNYWHGHRIPHPVHCNLRGLPDDLVIKIIDDFALSGSANLAQCPPSDRENSNLSSLDQRMSYADWLHTVYGRTYADTFPMIYGQKYHTTNMENLTTDWVGPRMHRPKLEDLLRGALSQASADVHYVQNYRYPSEGGFVAYIETFAKEFDVLLNHKLIRIDPRSKLLHFSNGEVYEYSAIISSIPLPDLVAMIADVPERVVNASHKLAYTSAVLVNIGIERSDISETAMTYFYDEDVIVSRVSLPHMLSENNAPAGCGSIQAEVYFSEKYKPLLMGLPAVTEIVVDNLRTCGFIRGDDEILMKDAIVSQYANVIFDRDRARAVADIHEYLDEIGIYYCGRYGVWDHSWTDQSFASGEQCAQRLLSNTSIRNVPGSLC